MTALKQNLKEKLNALQKFHNDEEGIEAIQVVLILGIAAVALIVINRKWNSIKQVFTGNVDEATQWEP